MATRGTSSQADTAAESLPARKAEHVQMPHAGTGVPYKSPRRFPRPATHMAAVTALLAGGGALPGWTPEAPGLQSVLPGFVTVKANTAVGFVLAGLALAMLGRADRSTRSRRLLQARAGAAAMAWRQSHRERLFLPEKAAPTRMEVA